MPNHSVTAPDGSTIQFPDSMADSDINAAMQKLYPPTSSQSSFLKAPSGATALQAAPKTFSLPWFRQKLQNVADPVTQSMPAIGSTLGAMIGGGGGTILEPGGGSAVGAVGGAGAGGMGGEAASQIIRRALNLSAPTTPQEAASDITKQGVVQAGVQTGSELLPFLAGPLKNAALKQYERALAPTTNINKAITQDIAPQMIERGEYGTLQGLEKKAGQKISELNPQLTSGYAQLQGAGKIPGSGTQVISDLEQLKQSYMPEGVVAQPSAVNAIQGVQDIVKQYGPDVSPNSLRRLRQIFEDPVAKAGGYAGADLSTSYTLNAQQQAADSIRSILNKTPNIGDLNKEISFWLDVQRVTSQSGLRRTGQEGGLMKVLAPLGAAAAGGMGLATRGATAGAEGAGASMLAAIAIQVTRSPAWRTATAVAKTNLANALARGDVGAVTALAARFGIAATQMNTQGTQTNP